MHLRFARIQNIRQAFVRRWSNNSDNNPSAYVVVLNRLHVSETLNLAHTASVIVHEFKLPP